MKKWERINKALKNISGEEETRGYLRPFREEIQNKLKKSETKKIGPVFREIRAKMLSDLRVNFALLEAAAYEEELELKK